MTVTTIFQCKVGSETVSGSELAIKEVLAMQKQQETLVKALEQLKTWLWEAGLFETIKYIDTVLESIKE